MHTVDNPKVHIDVYIIESDLCCAQVVYIPHLQLLYQENDRTHFPSTHHSKPPVYQVCHYHYRFEVIVEQLLYHCMGR